MVFKTVQIGTIIFLSFTTKG